MFAGIERTPISREMANPAKRTITAVVANGGDRCCLIFCPSDVQPVSQSECKSLTAVYRERRWRGERIRVGPWIEHGQVVIIGAALLDAKPTPPDALRRARMSARTAS